MLRLITVYVLIKSSKGGQVQCASNCTSRSVAASLQQQSDDLTKRLCGVSRPLPADTPANRICSITKMGESMLVVLGAVMRSEMKSCRHTVDPMRSWKENAGCALLMLLTYRFKALQKNCISRAKRDNVSFLLKSSQSLILPVMSVFTVVVTLPFCVK